MITVFGINEVKAKAKELLEQTDYVVLSDVNITNKDEFISFRSNVRMAYLYPNYSFTFQDVPTPIWGTTPIATSPQPNTDLPQA
jgi:hypothetical protein